MKHGAGIAYTAAAAALGLLVATPALATVQRTFVSTGGSDAAACSLTAPCRTFAAAMVQTTAGGEVVVLESGGYGPTTITKAVSIVTPAGTYAGISVAAGLDGIVVNAGPTDEVILRGVTINAQGGNNGVVFNSGAALYIESCTIRGFATAGTANVKFAPSGASKLFVKDSFFRGGANGVLLANGATAASVTIDNTRIESNGVGVSAATFGGSVALRNSIVTESTSHGVNLTTAGAQALDVALDNVLVSNSGGNGLNVAGGGITVAVTNSTLVKNAVGAFAQGGATAATVRLTNNVISRNTTGIGTGANGAILTPQSNTIEGNGTDGTASGNYTNK